MPDDAGRASSGPGRLGCQRRMGHREISAASRHRDSRPMGKSQGPRRRRAVYSGR